MHNRLNKMNLNTCINKYYNKIMEAMSLKEKVEFWGEVKKNCERYYCYYASVEEHQRKKSSLKSMASNAFIF